MVVVVGHEGMGMSCDGVPPTGEGGTLMGHVLPGILFVVWGSWWAYNVCLRSVGSVRNKMVFESQPFYRFPRERMSLMEPVLKIVLPIIAMSMECTLIICQRDSSICTARKEQSMLESLLVTM
eukprot:jgi/Picre1/33783/NNA_001262.t1